jgi:hypothetical protein
LLMDKNKITTRKQLVPAIVIRLKQAGDVYSSM